MKKLLFALVLALVATQAVLAQGPEQSVGLRYGADFGLGTEISYQRNLISGKRLEFDLGFNSRYEYINTLRQDYNSWALTGLYQWIWKLDKVDANLSWYAGYGGKMGFWSSSQKYDSRYKNGIFLVAAGDVGIQYAFPVIPDDIHISCTICRNFCRFSPCWETYLAQAKQQPHESCHLCDALPPWNLCWHQPGGNK